MALLWAAVARADDLYGGSCDDTSPSWSSSMTLAQGELYKTIYSATYSSDDCSGSKYSEGTSMNYDLLNCGIGPEDQKVCLQCANGTVLTVGLFADMPDRAAFETDALARTCCRGLFEWLRCMLPTRVWRLSAARLEFRRPTSVWDGSAGLFCAVTDADDSDHQRGCCGRIQRASLFGAGLSVRLHGLVIFNRFVRPSGQPPKTTCGQLFD
jgi:hypothetical protein